MTETTRQEEVYVPPKHLPPPPEIPAGNPFLGLLAGLAAAVLSGAALYALGHLIYIYVLYNAAVGFLVGKGLGLAAKRGSYTNSRVLLVFAALYSVVPYLVYTGFILAYALKEGGYVGMVDVGMLPRLFWEVLKIRAHQETIMGIGIGPVGNTVLWLTEVGITFYYAQRTAMAAVALKRLGTIPEEVVLLVLHFLSEGKSVPEVQQELAARGWVSPEAQRWALLAAQDVVQAVQRAKNE
jgi:hypothetical protein